MGVQEERCHICTLQDLNYVKSDSYLATIRRDRWSVQMTMKKDNKLKPSSAALLT